MDDKPPDGNCQDRFLDCIPYFPRLFTFLDTDDFFAEALFFALALFAAAIPASVYGYFFPLTVGIESLLS